MDTQKNNRNNNAKIFYWIFTVLTISILIVFLVSIFRVVETGSSGSLGTRIGAICEDGWRSYSTGSGTCSWHGGVDDWIYRGGYSSSLEEHRLIVDTYPWLIGLTLLDIIIFLGIKHMEKNIK